MADATSPPRTMTADELFEMPGDARRELVRGVLHEMPPAGGAHGEIAASSAAVLVAYAREHGGLVFGAETGFLLDRNPDTVRAPDAAYVRADRTQAMTTESYLPGPPDLAVEAVSPNDTYSEVHDKALVWITSGCRVVLVVDRRARRVIRYRAHDDVVTFDGDEAIDCAPAMPGFMPAVSELLGRR